jgi:pimeloyl-ACP methyl ester carboxylesterase
LKNAFTAVLFDARGHGKSDKTHEPAAHELALVVGDMVAVLDAPGIDKAHYWGYSMGGRIGLGLVNTFPMWRDRTQISA